MMGHYGMKKLFVLLFLSLVSHSGFSEQSINPEIKKSLVIISSSKDYSGALKVAQEASSKIAIPLNLRALSENKKAGLSFDKKTCIAGPVQEYPCYQKRGKYDDGTYISIEYSSEYKEMTPELYIVVVYSGSEAGKINSTLEKVKSLYKDAFRKNIKIYMD